MTVIAGTGHRPEKLGGHSDRVHGRLVDLARAALLHYRPSKVISGMALGWDTALAEAALELGIPLVAAVPFAGQELRWPATSQKRYRDILGRAEEVVIVSPGSYAVWKMQTRNEWMVDHCDKLLTLWDGSEGGTGNCVAYARRVQREMGHLWATWQRYREADTVSQLPDAEASSGPSVA